MKNAWFEAIKSGALPTIRPLASEPAQLKSYEQLAPEIKMIIDAKIFVDLFDERVTKRATGHLNKINDMPSRVEALRSLYAEATKNFFPSEWKQELEMMVPKATEYQKIYGCGMRRDFSINDLISALDNLPTYDGGHVQKAVQARMNSSSTGRGA
jgi:hypothetical protein